MSVLACLRRPPQLARAWYVTRTYAKKVEAAAPPRKVVIPQVPEGALSTCRPTTPLVGINYLKDQEEVLALADEEYPPWLWDLLKPKVLPDDGPGGKAEKVRLRKENRARIREQNFMKTQ